MTEPDHELSKRVPSGHEWANTCLAGLALLVSLASAVFSRQANDLHRSNLVLSIDESQPCKEVTFYRDSKDKRIAALVTCWRVIVSNQSEDRAVITSISLADKKSYEGIPTPRFKMGMTHVLTADGPEVRFSVHDPLASDVTVVNPKSGFPLRIDGGDAAVVEVAIGFPMTKDQLTWLGMAMDPYRLTPNASGAFTSEPIHICQGFKDLDAAGECSAHFEFKLATAAGAKQSLLMVIPDQFPTAQRDIADD